jgi:hypothetical protein
MIRAIHPPELSTFLNASHGVRSHPVPVGIRAEPTDAVGTDIGASCTRSAARPPLPWRRIGFVIPERREREALPSPSDDDMARCAGCGVLKLAWNKTERLEKELAQVRAELDRVRNYLSHGRAVTDLP